MQVLYFWAFSWRCMGGSGGEGWASWGSSRAKDGIQGVRLVHVSVAKFCLSQFQDHIRVTLGLGTSEGRTGSGESGQGGQEWGRNEPLHQTELVGRGQSGW